MELKNDRSFIPKIFTILNGDPSLIIENFSNSTCNGYVTKNYMIDFWKNRDYEIKSLDFYDVKKSCHYNPFLYIKDKNDIMSISKIWIEYTGGDRTTGERGEDYFPELFLLASMIAYVWENNSTENKNLEEVTKVLNDICENGFDKLRNINSDSVTFDFYTKFRKTCPDTAEKAVMISLSVRLCIVLEFDNNILTDDTIDLYNLGNRKTIIFVERKPQMDCFDCLYELFLFQAMQICGKRNSKTQIVSIKKNKIDRIF